MPKASVGQSGVLVGTGMLACPARPAPEPRFAPPDRPGGQSPHRINRRAMLSRCLLAVGLRQPLARVAQTYAASGKPARSSEVRYQRLRSPVLLPLQLVREVWRPAPFLARCSKSNRTGSSATEALLKGILLRLPVPQPAGVETGLKAFCLMCPHELCELNFTEETRSERWALAARRNHPVLVCPCHFSVFDPLADGAAIAGPAERGAYRFRWKVRGSKVEIREVEEEALG